MVDGMESHWLTRRRNELELKQADVVRQLRSRGVQIDPSAISQWERGKSQPPLRDRAFRQALAEVLQVSVRELLILAEYEVDIPLADSSIQLAERIDQLSNDQQEVLQSILDMLQGSEKTAQVNVELRFSVGDESAVFTLPVRASKK